MAAWSDGMLRIGRGIRVRAETRFDTRGDGECRLYPFCANRREWMKRPQGGKIKRSVRISRSREELDQIKM